MKRFLAILLALVLLTCVAAGCNNGGTDKPEEGKTNPTEPAKTADAYTLLKEAVEKTNALDSIEAKMNAAVKMAAGGMTMEVPMKVEMQISGLKSEKPVSYVVTESELFSMKTVQRVYTDADTVYVDQGDAKFKVARDSEEAENYSSSLQLDSFVKVLPEEALKDASVTENADGSKSVSADIPADVFASYFKDMMSSMASANAGDADELDGAQFDVKSAHVDFTVLANGYLGIYNLAFNMDVTGPSGEDGAETATIGYDMKVDTEYVEPGKDVTVTVPADLDQYLTYDEYLSTTLDDDEDWDWDDDDSDSDWDDTDDTDDSDEDSDGE